MSDMAKVALVRIVKDWGSRKMQDGAIVRRYTIKCSDDVDRFVEVWSDEEDATIRSAIKLGTVLEFECKPGRYGMRYNLTKRSTERGANVEARSTPSAPVASDRVITRIAPVSGDRATTRAAPDGGRDKIILWQNALNVAVQLVAVMPEDKRTCSELLSLARGLYVEGVTRFFGEEALQESDCED